MAEGLIKKEGYHRGSPFQKILRGVPISKPFLSGNTDQIQAIAAVKKIGKAPPMTPPLWRRGLWEDGRRFSTFKAVPVSRYRLGSHYHSRLATSSNVCRRFEGFPINIAASTAFSHSGGRKNLRGKGDRRRRIGTVCFKM